MKSSRALDLAKQSSHSNNRRKRKRTYRPHCELLEDRIVPAAPMIEPIADQSLTFMQDTTQIAVAATDKDGDTLSYSVESAGSNAYFLDSQFDFQSVGKAPQAIAGDTARWFQAQDKQWYFIESNGEFFVWKGNKKESPKLLAVLDPIFYHIPELIYQAKKEDLAYQIDHSLDLNVDRELFENFGGEGERWLRGNRPMFGKSRPWYFIKPDGQFFSWDGTPKQASGILLARLDPLYFDQIQLLHDAQPHQLAVSNVGKDVTVGPPQEFVGKFVVGVTVSDGKDSPLATFNVNVSNANAPVLDGIDDQTIAYELDSDGNPINNPLVIPLNAVDGDGDAVTYEATAAGSPATFLDEAFKLKSSPPQLDNWGGKDERWLRGDHDWYFITPDGNLFRWDGSDRATGLRVDSLAPLFHHAPQLLYDATGESLEYQIDQQLGLRVNGGLWENWGGKDERWLLGHDGWYFLTPNGDLHHWDRTPRTASGTYLTTLDPFYYEQIDLLHKAEADRFDVDIADNKLTVTTDDNYVGNFYLQVIAGDGLHQTGTRFFVQKQSASALGDGRFDQGSPRIVGAVSTANNKVLVSFNHSMGASALKPEHYIIGQQSVNSEAGALTVGSVKFTENDPNHTTVELTTSSQNELTYTLTVVNVRDALGNPFDAPTATGGVVVDPSKANFAGTPPSDVELVDTDGDGLTDNEELRGWTVSVTLLNGSVVTREVTSNPSKADTDGDGLEDGTEATLGLDPRDKDTDDDLLTDFQEFNEIFSEPTMRDTDGDGLDDNSEFNFFFTAPFHADTDGDQILDGDEILGNRNARVSDLPRPEITVGQVKLTLDVRHVEITAEETRDLGATIAQTTLASTNTFTAGFSNTQNIELHMDTTAGTSVDPVSGKTDPFFGSSGGLSSGFAFSQTTESALEARREFEKTLQTETETTEGSTTERTVEAATMQLAVNLHNLSDLAYRVRNLQITALMQDPQDHTNLTPVATLLPDAEPEDGFTLGPLVGDRGPIIFSNDAIFPSLVESLMANSAGLIFRISNYDIIDENERNFAFTSQEIIDRTGLLFVDFGGASQLLAELNGDAIDQLNPPPQAEIHRVATSGGRAIEDTDGDGTVNPNRHRQPTIVNFPPSPSVLLPYEDGQEATDVGGGQLVVQSHGLVMGGNRWKAFEFPYTVTADTVFEFDYFGEGGEIHAIGFDDDLAPDESRVFQLSGSQTYGIQDFNDFPGGNSQIRYSIPIGQYFTGDIRYLTFIMDNDAAPDPQVISLFTNLSLEKEYAGDQRVIFDAAGKEVGITVHQALAGIGLTRYDENVTPTNTLTDEQILNSYSTIQDGNLERIHRIRGIENDAINDRFWQVLTNLGILPEVNLDTLILRSDAPISLSFVQDLDGDRLPADVEYFLRTSDSPKPVGAVLPAATSTSSNTVQFTTDPEFATGAAVYVDANGGGLNAGIEYFVRNLGNGEYGFYETATNAENDIGRIPLTDNIEANVGTVVPTETDTESGLHRVIFGTDPGFQNGQLVTVSTDSGGLMAGTQYFVTNLTNGVYSFHSSLTNALEDSIANRIPLTGKVTAIVGVPRGRDTDQDGLDDRFEALIGWDVTTPQKITHVYSSPNRADSNFDAPEDEADLEKYDGSDFFAAPKKWEDNDMNGLRDRFEVKQEPGDSDGDGFTDDFVLDPIRKDTDEDGIDDATEIIGFEITRITTGESEPIDGTNPNNPDTDGDTFSDGFEKDVGLDPNDPGDRDTDGDGLPDVVEEVAGWTVTTFGVSTQPYALEGSKRAVPDDTNVESNTVFLWADNDPGFETGIVVRVSATGGGLTAGADYFIHKSPGGFSLPNLEPTFFDISFYTTKADAIAGLAAERVDLTAQIKDIVAGHTETKMSSANSVDTDGDGLTDFEEFFLRTDPSSTDTDSDGIADRVEHLGYKLGHKVDEQDLGFIKTDPLDADTDNDLRSDGDEAELADIEQDRWIVRVVGEDPYRVFSNPLVADADFDGIVDGDEFNIGRLSPRYDEEDLLRTDPNDGNTDDDARDDGLEITRGTNPVEVDFEVTVLFDAVHIVFNGVDSTSGGFPGDIVFDLGVRLPSDSGFGGLSDDFTHVIVEQITGLEDFPRIPKRTETSDVEPELPPADLNSDPRLRSLQNDPTRQGIWFRPFSTLNLAQFLPVGNRRDIDGDGEVDATRSITFGMTADEAFTVEGLIAEWDDTNDVTDPRTKYVYLGGLSGNQALDPDGSPKPIDNTGLPSGASFIRPIFTGLQLLEKGPFIDIIIPFGDTSPGDGSSDGADNRFIDGPSTLQNGELAITGNLFFTIFVSGVPAPLHAESIGANAAAPRLTGDQVQPLLAEAIDRFAATGADVSALSDVRVQIADLKGTLLGQAVGNTIVLDVNAAGHGWFIDLTPRDDFEFTTPGDQGEQGYIDALSVIAHELGHVLGLEHEDEGVMQETLGTGERHLPSLSHTLDALPDAFGDDEH